MWKDELDWSGYKRGPLAGFFEHENEFLDSVIHFPPQKNRTTYRELRTFRIGYNKCRDVTKRVLILYENKVCC
jgi:hypothetical protein